MAESKISCISRGGKGITLTAGATTNVFSNQPGLYLIILMAQNMTTGGRWILHGLLNGSSTSSFELLDSADYDWKRTYATFCVNCNRLDIRIAELPTSPSVANVSYVKLA